MAEAQQQQPDGIPGALNIPDDPAPAPVDVDIESGKVTEVGDQIPPAKADDQQQQRTKPRPQVRIQNLTHERDTWQNTAQRLEQELAQARQTAQAERAGREQAERAGMENLVQRTKAEVVSAKAALIAAKNAGDQDAEVEAQTRLARAAAEEADADAWVAGQPKEQPQHQQQPQHDPRQPAPRQAEVAPLSGPVRDFLTDNTWFNAVQIGTDGRPVIDRQTGRPMSNPEFDEDLHDAALIEHRVISREIRTGKLPKDFVETPEYFERIRAKVTTEFPDAFEAEEDAPPPPRARAPQMGAGKQPVAPSNRQISTQQGQKQGSKMRLDGEEAALVRSLVDNGTMVYPRNHPDAAKRGQRMSHEDAYVKYAREKQADQASRGTGGQQ